MNAVDATDRTGQNEEAEPPSLLTIILDTNPHAWELLSNSLPLSKAVANLLVFVNAHLAINHANRVAILASHAERAEWLYPTPSPANPEDKAMNGTSGTAGDSPDPRGGPVQPPDDANKYRPFAHIEHAVLRNLQHLISTTTTTNLSSTPATMMAGALTLALSHISKQTPSSTSNRTAQFNYSDPTSMAGDNNLASNNASSHTTQNLESRILILSVSGDLSPQYIPLMNAIFAAQRLDIPIDILKLAGDTVFLQQAADATGGIYLALDTPAARAGLLQYLMFAYLPDAAARRYLVLPGTSQEGGNGVDFRAACFCHRRVVDIGFVCSICLSIFCEPLADGTCLTCGSALSMGNYGQRPVVVARRKKKKKQRVGGVDGGGGAETPGSAGGTPVPG